VMTVKMLAAGSHELAGMLEIAECTGHIKSGGKKDAGFITGLCLPHMTKNDPDKQLIDCLLFDGARTVQKVGKSMQVHYPRVMVLHGVEHVVSLFFKILSNMKVVKHQIFCHHFIYRVFGSGVLHPPYALFQRHARTFNNHIGLLRVSDTRMAGYFMAMHMDLRLKQALQATATGSDFIYLNISKSKDTAATIRDELEYQRVFHLLRATFPAFMIFRLADSNKPGMDQIYYLTRKATEAIEHGIIFLNNKTWLYASLMKFWRRRKNLKSYCMKMKLITLMR
jgi:phosphatidylglycerophosphatase A